MQKKMYVHLSVCTSERCTQNEVVQRNIVCAGMYVVIFDWVYELCKQKVTWKSHRYDDIIANMLHKIYMPILPATCRLTFVYILST